MTTPNTVSELVARNEQPECPYCRPVVRETMDFLTEDERTNAGDIQAVAELCIDLLKTIAAGDLERHHEHCEVADLIKEALRNIEAAEHFIEKAPFINMNADAEEV